MCGYVHRGSAAPKSCPICGASQTDFEPSIEQAAPAVALSTGVWRCLNCGFVYEGEKALQMCPVCKHPQTYFEIVTESF